MEINWTVSYSPSRCIADGSMCILTEEMRHGADFLMAYPKTVGKLTSQICRTKYKEIMKRIELILSFGLMLLPLFATSANAESPREQFMQMIAIPGRSYEIGKYEVTQGEWVSVMGNNPSEFKGANLPVEKVNWNDIQEFLTKLNQKTGKRYRLPTEAEWEYACYGGSKTEYCGGNDVDSVAWVKGNSGGQTHPVGQKQANGYGLYDMSGNVWEWMSDCSKGSCAQRVICGGSWLENPLYMHATDSLGLDARGKGTDIGFRLVRTLP